MTTPDIKKMAIEAFKKAMQEHGKLPKKDSLEEAVYIAGYITGAGEILEYINKHYENPRN